jgi:hypothetical protein
MHGSVTKTQAAAGMFAMVALGYGLAQVRAEGPPKSQPLWYSGTIATSDGRPLDEESAAITLALFAANPPAPGEEAVCTVARTTPLVRGRFRVDASECLGAVQSHADLFAELRLGDKRFERAKISAVPYAVEAQRAGGAGHSRTADAAAVAESAKTALALKRSVLRESRQCTASSPTSMDCTCNADELAIGGGGYAGVNNGLAESANVFGASSRNLQGWRVACTTAQCSNTYALCMKVSP